MIDTNTLWVWPRAEGGLSTDLTALQTALADASRALGFSRQELGRVVCPDAEMSIDFLTRPAARPDAPRLLLATGFHGEESAGPWGLLRLLQQLDPQALEQVHLSLLPLVNPSGFRVGRRFNDWGENPNRGYPSSRCLDGTPSREARLLIAHAALLVPAGADGVLCCHEDVGLSEAYLYSFERSEQAGAFSQRLLAANLAHFAMHPDGLVDDCPIRGGIVFNHYDASFEAWMMEQGAARAACVETPGQQPLERRILAQAAMMRVFIEQADKA
ncbi:M14 family metallopeptidase [Roseateles oligotrophus]|uniref:M14 family metallocarboxypeptidase n=1 Tax=Roseateles oligotrophus TaxID=1769250 RepID=A0ABT2YJ41_9BURK|nr:M14 family metallocarboxypeptidase [Roseateles oligotrophus]MCV2370089.1 M14 family metallocarboxypeptidase [Roseateles oligotrophus]